MKSRRGIAGSLRAGLRFFAALVIAPLFFSMTACAQGVVGQVQKPNKILGEVQLVGKNKVDKISGVWIDGEYVGYVDELKDDKRILLLPGEHQIDVRQTGYKDFVQKVVVEPGKKTVLDISLQKDPQAQYSAVTGEIKLDVTPKRAAVFLDGAFVGTVHEFSGLHAMLVSPGKHRVKIALPGYRDFATDVTLAAHQKITIKTDLVEGSVTESGPAVTKPE